MKQQITDAWRVTLQYLESDLFIFLQTRRKACLYTRHNLPTSYSILENTQMKPFSLYIFQIYLLLVIFHGRITLLSEKKFVGRFLLSVVYKTPSKFPLYRGIVHLLIEYASHIRGVSTHLTLFQLLKSLIFCFIIYRSHLLERKKLFQLSNNLNVDLENLDKKHKSFK